MKIIINADDFGLSHDVNLAIVEAFKKGYITNTTIMVNMPGFDEAIKLSKDYGFFDKVGVHFNVFAGIPLYEGMQDVPLFFQDGNLTSFRFFHQSSLWEKLPNPFNRKITEALKKEATMQIERYLNAGFTEMHFDSHGHAHTYPVVWDAIAPVFRKYGFRTTRRSLNCPAISGIKNIYKSIINYRISSKFNTTSYFASGAGFMSALSSKCNIIQPIEIMVHPGYDNGELKNLGNHPDFPIMIAKAKEVGELCGFKDL